MICHKHKCILVHIPKTGGSAIEKLFNVWGIDNTGNNEIFDRNIMFGKDSQHFPYNKILKNAECDVSKYYSFTFVRNPWAKMVSEYHWRQGWCQTTKHLSFMQFLRKTGEQVNSIDGSKNIESLIPISHFLPQHSFIMENGKLLVDYVGRFENLQDDFNIVCDKIGIPQQNLPHTNKTNHRPYTEGYYNDEGIEIITNLYKKDIELFGYEFGE